MKLGNCEILSAIEGVRGADVYEVELVDSGRRMAVRIASRAVPPLSAAAEESERFLAEAAPFVALEHPNVLPLVDYGEQDGLRFMIDPFVGGPLLDFLVSGQSLPLPLPVARSIIADAAAGLQYLHDQGIVHGCVNVRTLIMEHAAQAGTTARVRVGDFGLHRFFEEGAPAGQMFEEFLAPEQHHEPAQAASDQYALAVLAHLLLTGRLPVISSRSRPIEDVSPGDLVPPSQLNPALPPAIDFLLNTALQPDPEKRFHQVRDLATALEIATGVAQHPAAVDDALAAAQATSAPQTHNATLHADASEATSIPTPVPVAAPTGAQPLAPLSVPPLAPPPADPVYLLPKAPPYTEPVRAVKASAKPTQPRKALKLPGADGLRMSRRTLLLGAGGLAGVAVLGGGAYFFIQRSRAGNAVADSIGVFRASASSFLLLSSLAAHTPDIVVPFGQAGDLPVSGDWDGDGIDTPGVFRPATGMFYLAGSNGHSPHVVHTVAFGQRGDIPLAGDWTGSGRDSIGVYRPSTGRFLLKRTLDPGPADLAVTFGSAHDLPLAGDWTGSGRDSIGVYRPNDDAFLLVAHIGGQRAVTADYTLHLGVGHGLPLAGDWQQTGHSGIGLFVPATHTVYLKQRLADGSAPDRQIVLGAASDLPVAGHWR